jgi:hypothetical protein
MVQATPIPFLVMARCASLAALYFLEKESSRPARAVLLP